MTIMNALRNYIIANDGSFGCSARYWEEFEKNGSAWCCGYATSLLDAAVSTIGRDLLLRLIEASEMKEHDKALRETVDAPLEVAEQSVNTDDAAPAFCAR